MGRGTVFDCSFMEHGTDQPRILIWQVYLFGLIGAAARTEEIGASRATRALPRARATRGAGCIYSRSVSTASRASIPPRNRAGSATRWRCCGFILPGSSCSTHCSASRTCFRSTRRVSMPPAGPVAEHGRQLCYQHQLAVLWRRDDAEQFLADGRDHGPIVSLLRHGGCRSGGAGARYRSPFGGDDRNFWVALTRITL